MFNLTERQHDGGKLNDINEDSKNENKNKNKNYDVNNNDNNNSNNNKIMMITIAQQ